jgi:hypothetical protein
VIRRHASSPQCSRGYSRSEANLSRTRCSRTRDNFPSASPLLRDGAIPSVGTSFVSLDRSAA